MVKENACAVMKKFFVIILDTPSVAHTSHRFYERAGFYQISTEELPVPYTYPDRDCLLYMLDIEG